MGNASELAVVKRFPSGKRFDDEAKRFQVTFDSSSRREVLFTVGLIIRFHAPPTSRHSWHG